MNVTVPVWALFVSVIVLIVVGGMIVGALWRDESSGGYFGDPLPVQGCLVAIVTMFLVLVTLAVWGWVV
jgi:hypothetical protein